MIVGGEMKMDQKFIGYAWEKIERWYFNGNLNEGRSRNVSHFNWRESFVKFLQFMFVKIITICDAFYEIFPRFRTILLINFSFHFLVLTSLIMSNISRWFVLVIWAFKIPADQSLHSKTHFYALSNEAYNLPVSTHKSFMKILMTNQWPKASPTSLSSLLDCENKKNWMQRISLKFFVEMNWNIYWESHEMFF